jgi:hypothetical protein
VNKQESGRCTIEYFADIPEGQELLERIADKAFFEELCAKYHYPVMELDTLLETASAIRDCMLKDAAFSYKGSERISAVITLGEGIDRLQEEYTLKGMLSESYMAEVISGEILMASYMVLNRLIYTKTGLYVKRYIFPGSTPECSVEEVERLVEDCGLNVSINSSFCMIPKKSVAFYALLTDDDRAVCEGICMGCNRTDCPNRAGEEAFNYGFARIFGRSYK